MPAIYYNPVSQLLARNGDNDGDDDGGFHMPGSVMAIIIVCVIAFVAGTAVCCCLCRRRRKNRNGDGGSKNSNEYGVDSNKWIKKAIKKAAKKIKKMFSKNKKKNAAAAAVGGSVPYGQGTHPGYGENERTMGYSGGYGRLDAHGDEEMVGMTSPHGVRN
ncbi:uncharacterized protein CTRU02_204177 [Colletotrichum truncatum]|uniref:Uncharacterized protein n=1 Tax=Colletotrichum truncatum TaxID=5467 RepID=A0ACC3ZB81_COLTU|nr:uncharacterized protein CTRU02_10030 [Colletotrichum truncatum]KAF6787735.1 hypothetical protein CTRU02_10030 [Colletotrichum truncatum]